MILTILAVSLLLQVVAAVLALQLVRITGKPLAWVLIAGAIGLMALRRAITLWGVVRFGESGPDSLPSELVALTISVLMLLGIAAIKPLFETAGKLEELESRFGRVLDNSLSEFYIFSAASLRFLRVNLGARQNLGYTSAELARMTPLDLKTEFTEETFRAMLEPLERDEVPRLRLRAFHRRKDGTVYPVDVDLQKTHFGGEPAYLTTTLDTTQRDRAEQALRDSEEHFRSLIENSQDVTTIIDPDGTVAWQSSSMQRVLGHDAATRVGRSVLDLLHPDDVGAVRQALARARERPEETQTLIYRLRHVDGSWRTMESLGRVRRLADGRSQYVVNQRDVTERVVALREKAAIEGQLQHVQRMETLWTLAGGIAHDFNNLLTPIIGYAHLLEERLQGAEEPREILRAAGRAQRLVQQLLTFSRQTGVELRPIELQETVAEALQLVRAALPSDISLETRLDAAGEAVLADSTQIHQVVMNLCANAGQAMKTGGGRLTVSLARVDEVPVDPTLPSATSSGPFLRLSIADTGPGLDTAVRERIFDPFFTTRENGVGLGLSIVQGIVLGHGGAVRVHSVAGEGARFDVYLPQLGEYAKPDEAAVAARSGGEEHVLVVDDEEAVARVAARLLEARSYRVSLAAGPEEALEILRGGGVDLVVTDQTMPGMSGLELATRIRRDWPRLPVILMSGFTQSVTTERKERAGIAATLSKPFAGPELAECVRAVLDERGGAGPRDGARDE